jgi:uncharacterized damage-inducible protein DinB
MLTYCCHAAGVALINYLMIQKTSEMQMSSASLVKDYTAYNLWANKRIVKWLRSKPAEVVEQKVLSSFSSLRLTLVHIWDVERSWLGRLLQVEMESNYGKDYDGTLEEVFDVVVQQSEALNVYVQSLTEESLQELTKFMVPIRWPEWDEVICPRSQVIQHCLNHSTYHRGQIVTIAHNVGLTDPPTTDYMAFLLREKIESKAS